MVNWRRLLLIYKYRNKKKGLSQNIIFKLKTARIPTNLVWYPCRFWRAATLNWKILTDLRQPLFFVSKKTKRRSVYLLPISETATNSATNFLSAYCLYSTRHLDFYQIPIDNTKPICYNIAKKNSHVVLISVSEVFIWQTAKTETSLLTALWAL